MENIKPFDMGAPPAELPTGSWNAPPTGTVVSQDQPAPVFVPPLDEGLIAQAQLSPEMAEAVRQWWPHIFGRRSEHTGGYVTTVPGVVMHIEGFLKQQHKVQRAQERERRNERAEQRETAEEADKAHANAIFTWQKECQARNAWIEEKSAEWRKRIEQRKIALAQWDAYVAEARSAYQDAKATLPPPRPVKS
jgi:hypothetical protein